MTTWEPGASDVLTQGLTFRPFADGLFGDQSGTQHDGRIGGVGAGGDGGDNDSTVVQFEILTVDCASGRLCW